MISDTISYHGRDGTGKPPLNLTVNRQYKSIDNIVMVEWPLRSDGTQRVIEEELSNFWNINEVYKMSRLKPLI